MVLSKDLAFVLQADIAAGGRVPVLAFTELDVHVSGHERRWKCIIVGK